MIFYAQRQTILSSLFKGKDHKKYKWILSKSIWKTAHFDTNCMEIGFLFMKILRLYVFKMAANGGHHFEINTWTKNYKTQFISKNHAHIYTFDKGDLCLLCKYSIYRVILWILYFYKALLEKKKINIQCELVTSQPHWFSGSQLDISIFSIFNNFLV